MRERDKLGRRDWVIHTHTHTYMYTYTWLETAQDIKVDKERDTKRERERQLYLLTSLKDLYLVGMKEGLSLGSKREIFSSSSAVGRYSGGGLYDAEWPEITHTHTHTERERERER